MLAFVFSYWFDLRDEFAAVFTIVISPTVYFRNFARPVAMPRTKGNCPLEGACAPWVETGDFASLEDRIEEVDYEKDLYCENDEGDKGDELIEATEVFETLPIADIIIAP